MVGRRGGLRILILIGNPSRMLSLSRVKGLTRLSLVVPFPLAAGALTNFATQKVDKSTDFVFGHLCLQTEFAT